MSCIFWNCQGLGAPLTIHVLGDILRDHRPLLVFLSETRATHRDIEKLKTKWCLNGVGVERVGNSGGLALLWKKEIEVSLMSYSNNHIDAEVLERDRNSKWRVTGFYGFPKRERKQLSWDLLRNLHAQSPLPWLVAGDFNDILCNSEKSGGPARGPSHIEAFRSTLEDCGLVDLGFEGSPYTWSNNRASPYTVKCRLDRVCVNNNWIGLFPRPKFHHLDYSGSDHIPIKLTLSDTTDFRRARKRRPFRFEATWIRKEECEDIINHHWRDRLSDDPIDDLLRKNDECRIALIDWSRLKIKQPRRQIEMLHKKIHALSAVVQTESIREEIRALRAELERAYDDNDMYWRQRSKIQWIQEGDRNTKFFHSKATIRNKTNRVSKLRDSAGCWKENEVDIEQIVTEYFGQIFKSTNPNEEEIDEVLENIETRVSGAASHLLSMPFTVPEVTRAISQMAPLKSPGPDGLPVFFYTKYWHILGSSVSSCILEFLNSHKLPSAMNFTYIVLIPKIKNPEKITEYRPISLCNVIYKIGSKVVANRLKLVLNDLISPCQSAFVPKRLITDNVLVAFEINHFIKLQSRAKTNYMALKLDISKAYDRIEWVFLRKILLRFGIPVDFVTLVMLCVSTVSFSFLFNGSQFGFVTPSRGLRQGDPISPYLFICCAEALVALIARATERGEFQGVRVAPTAPVISNLCFADDTLIFGEATEDYATKLKEILSTYARVSGQEINYEKSTMMFSPSTNQDRRNAIHHILGFQVVDQHERYLGMPTNMGKTKKEIFSFLRDRVWSKIKGWGEKQLSKAGKEVLIKAVLQAIPSYIMSCFVLPKGLVQEIETAIRRFWWGSSVGKGVAWISWKELCKSKEQGGLGFRDLQIFNTALLVKQAWRLLTSPDLLLSKILSARYFPNGQVLSAELGSRPSATWRSIWSVIPYLQLGIRRRIGNGLETSIWADPWLNDGGKFRVFTRRPAYSAFPNRVADILEAGSNSWNMEIINNTFWPVDISRILAIPVGSASAADRWIWHFSSHGKFSVRSCYHAILSSPLPCGNPRSTYRVSSSGSSSRTWKEIWQLRIPPKVRIFLWRLLTNILPTNAALFRRKIIQSPICRGCNEEEETALHVILKCGGMEEVWNCNPFANLVNKEYISMWNWFEDLKKLLSGEERSLAVIIAWKAWENRNKKATDEQALQPSEILSWCKNYIGTFNNAQLCPSAGLRDVHPSVWKPPPAGVVKLNFDAGFPTDNNFFFASAVARDCAGNCLGWKVEKIPGKLRPVEGEAVAALKAMYLAKGRGWRDIVLEGDCIQLIQALGNKGSEGSSYGAIVEECISLENFFDSCSFQFIKRSGNCLAHNLAKIQCNGVMENFDLPSALADIV